MKLEGRHYAFIGLAVVVTVSMLLGIQPEQTPSAETIRMYEFLNSLPEGTPVILSFDHEASSLPEISPLALSLMRHLFSRNLRPIGVALLAEGTGVGYGLMRQVANEYDKKYGQDFVYLGFRPQYIAAILSMGESIRATFPKDYLGNDYDDLELLDSIRTYDDIAAVISIADGSFTTHWIEYGHGRYNVRVAAFVAAAMMTTYDPYLASGQLHAMVGGLKGAAEYEKLIGIGGSGSRGMLAQTVSHLYVILLIIIGNVLYFRGRRRGEGN